MKYFAKTPLTYEIYTYKNQVIIFLKFTESLHDTKEDSQFIKDNVYQSMRDEKSLITKRIEISNENSLDEESEHNFGQRKREILDNEEKLNFDKNTTITSPELEENISDGDEKNYNDLQTEAKKIDWLKICESVKRCYLKMTFKTMDEKCCCIKRR